MTEYDHPNPGARIKWLLPINGGPILDAKVSRLVNPQDLTAGTLPERFSLAYALGCILYHCKAMVERYSEITKSFSSRPMPDEAPVRMLYGWQEKPLFEFEGVINAGFRALECLRQPLWRRFGNKGCLPRSFLRVVDNCSQIPTSLITKIEHITADFFDHAKEYRDCLEHYLSPLAPRNFADMRIVPPGVWTMSTWLPKNPEARRWESFEYDSDTGGLGSSDRKQGFISVKLPWVHVHAAACF